VEVNGPQPTLPWSWYTDPEILRLEELRALRPGWHYVGHAGQLDPSGGFFPTTVAGVPVVLTRRDDGIRALVNVCRHRGAVVCETAGSRDVLQCPYHAWSYELDGRLRHAPRSDREPSFDPSAHSLAELPVGHWGPMLFVSPDPAAVPFGDTLADLPERVAEAGIDVAALRFLKRTESDYRANWKVCVENYLECYHCRVAHPGFARVIATGADDYRLEPSPTYSSQYGPLREHDPGDYPPGGTVPRGQFHFLFPNTMLNILPGHPNLSIGPAIPTAPGTTHRVLDYFVSPDAPDDWIQGVLAFDDRVGEEDRVLVESVQRGMEAGTHERGTLLTDSEGLIAHFRDWLSGLLAEPS
jgi:choline monooxygenase